MMTAFAPSVPAISRSSLQLVEFKREDLWLTKSRSYLMSSSVVNHGSGIKKTGQDLVHWQVLLLFKRVWHVCTILGNRCKAMQYLSTHSKSTIPKSQENNRFLRALMVSHGLSWSLMVSHGLSAHLSAAE